MRAKGSEAFDLDEEPRKAPREVRPQSVRPRLPAGSPTRRAGSAIRRSFVVRRRQRLGWDTHVENFKSVQSLSETLDAGFATLIADLADRGLLSSTLMVWMGEFGRTPKINANNGRDHFPVAWSTVLMGGGIRGGQVIGKTEPDGMSRCRPARRRRRLSGHDLRGSGHRPDETKRVQRRTSDPHHRSQSLADPGSARMIGAATQIGWCVRRVAGSVVLVMALVASAGLRGAVAAEGPSPATKSTEPPVAARDA